MTVEESPIIIGRMFTTTWQKYPYKWKLIAVNGGTATIRNRSGKTITTCIRTLKTISSKSNIEKIKDEIKNNSHNIIHLRGFKCRNS